MPNSLKSQKNNSKLSKELNKKDQRLIKRAEPYANALFSVALETLNQAEVTTVLNVSGLISNKKKLPTNIEFFDIYRDMELIHKAFGGEVEIVGFFESQNLPGDKKKDYFGKFFPAVNKKILNLIYLLIDNNKVDLIAEIAKQTIEKYWNYLQVRNYDLMLGQFGTQCEANFISYQFSSILREVVDLKDNKEKKVEITPKVQIKSKYNANPNIIGGFNLSFAHGTGFLNFTVDNEFNKFFGRIDKKSSNS